MAERGIIFDMDGVIVDTEFLDYQFQREFIAKENDEDISDMTTDHAALVGKSYDDLYHTLNSFLKKSYSLAELKKKFDPFYEAKYHNVDFKKLFRTDIIGILDYAKQNGIKLAVASSSEHDRILEVLKCCGISEYFDVLYSGEFVRESKPHPEIYTNTLAQLGVTKENAVAIEDSFCGISAAKSAGITTIAYRETRMNTDQSAADYIGDGMLEIKEIISEKVFHL